MSKENKKGDVKIIVERECIGNATPIQAILPIVMEDIKRKMEANRRLENKDNPK